MWKAWLAMAIGSGKFHLELCLDHWRSGDLGAGHDLVQHVLGDVARDDHRDLELQENHRAPWHLAPLLVSKIQGPRGLGAWGIPTDLGDISDGSEVSLLEKRVDQCCLTLPPRRGQTRYYISGWWFG